MAGTLLTADEAAQRLRVHPWRLRELCRMGLIPKGTAVRVGRRLMIDGSALESWIEQGGAQHPAQADGKPPAVGAEPAARRPRRGAAAAR